MDSLFFLALILFFLGGIIIYSSYSFLRELIRCPYCNKSLFHLVKAGRGFTLVGKTPAALLKRLDVCPFCAGDLRKKAVSRQPDTAEQG